jgi:hypothetical protein
MISYYNHNSMFSTVKYYKLFKTFIVKHLFGWVSCIKHRVRPSKKKGSFINHPNSPIVYDPDFSFVSPETFPPKLPTQYTCTWHT